MKFKPTKLDKFIGVFSPSAMNKRMISRVQNELLMQRSYEGPILNNANKTSKSINKQMSGKIAMLREDVRDVLRGSPFAKKGLDVIVNGVVGWGIEPIITHKDKTREEKIRAEWKRWAGGLCSVDGFSDFNTMQNQAMQAIVGDGEALLREVKDAERKCISLQVLESDYIADQAAEINFTKEEQKLGVARIINGVAVDEYGKALYYFLYTSHPGDNQVPKIVPVPASELIHPFRLERPGQVRGISWFSAVGYSFRHLQNLQDTHLTKMTLSSAITAVITQDPSLANPADLIKQREADNVVEGGTTKYLNPGEEISFPTIPNVEGFEGSTKLTLREAAAGLGITYESLSNDLQGVNFSSGRLGDLQFRANIEQWRWHMLVPRFLNPAFEKFKKHCAMNGILIDGVEVRWTPPARQMLSPVEEVNATKSAIRAGLMTYPEALRELGLDPDRQMKEIQESNEALDKHGIVLDSDPRKTGNGQLQSPQALDALNKNNESTEEDPTKTDKNDV